MNSLEDVQAAAKLVTQRMATEESFPELWDLLNASSSGDYALDKPAQFVHRGVALLPDILFEQYDMLQCKCFMGLLPEINRAWLSIDHRFFLWNYEDGDDFVAYEKLDHVIISAALAPLKSHVPMEDTQYVLVLATPWEITLVRVLLHQNTTTSSEITLLPTGLSVSSDTVPMLALTSTPDGRIFMAGKDGHLYEFDYGFHPERDRWPFSLGLSHDARLDRGRYHCRKINHTASLLSLFAPTFLRFSARRAPIVSLLHDPQRQLLFALSEQQQSAAIHAYTLASSGTVKHIATLSSLASHAQRLCPRGAHLLSASTFKIIAIHRVNHDESHAIHLVALTSQGVRLYFTTYDRFTRQQQQQTTMNGKQRNALLSTTLELIHVRLPAHSTAMNPSSSPRSTLAPGHPSSSSSSSSPLQHVHAGYYAYGTTLQANAVSDDVDRLSCITLDTSDLVKSQRRAFVEVCMDMSVEGKTWAIHEKPLLMRDAYQQSLLGYRKHPLAVQHALPARQFLVLTHTGIHRLQQQRPVDHLSQLLWASNGTDTEALRAFFDIYTRDEACAMCLLLGCTNPRTNTSMVSVTSQSAMITTWATFAYFRFGGEPVLLDKPHMDALGMGRPLSLPEVSFSGMHNGLILYVTRLLRPLWRATVLTVDATRRVASLVAESLLVPIQEDLLSLDQFLVRNASYFSPQRRADLYVSLGDAQDRRRLEEAIKMEQRSMTGLQTLIQQTLEALAMLSLLHDYTFEAIAQGLSVAQQEELAQTTFEQLLTMPRGRELARMLLNTLVARHVREQMAVDAITQVLRERCPSFFSSSDVLLHKGKEWMERATGATDREERQTALAASLKLFSQMAAQLDATSLASICSDYLQLEDYPAVVTLSLLCASEWDPLQHAMSYYAEQCPMNDPREEYFRKRQWAYEEIFKVLSRLHFPGVSSVDPSTTSASPLKRQDPESAVTFKRWTYQKMTASSDQLFHMELYEWLLSHSLSTVLLELQTPFLESYLTSKLAQYPDLLWQFYVRQERFGDAARLLLSLAEDTTSTMGLERRVEYLSLAMANAKSALVTRHGQGEMDGRSQRATSDNAALLMSDLEERMQVAQLQMQIYRAMSADAEEIRVTLDRQLYDISTLYNEYAKPWHLNDVALAILECSGHRDAAVISELWNDIISGEIQRANEAGMDPFLAISAKTKELGLKYYPSDIAFPLVMLIGALERCNDENHRQQESDEMHLKWVYETMREIGVPFAVLFDVYTELLLNSKSYGWHEATAWEHLVKVTLSLTKAWQQRQEQQDGKNDRMPVHAVKETLRKLNERVSVEIQQDLPRQREIQMRMQMLVKSLVSE